LSHLANRGFAHDSFYHVLVFPNLFIASTEGYSFYVGHAIPMAPNRTMLRVRYFEPAMEFTDKHRVRQNLINEQTRTQALKIIEEDRPTLENVQQGIEISERCGFVAASEVRVRAFLDIYDSLMNGVRVEDPIP
jgi:phenylpropionate dioxygenase-like ring-hydroxylating dioxygenase large terminal subunit